MPTMPATRLHGPSKCKLLSWLRELRERRESLLAWRASLTRLSAEEPDLDVDRIAEQARREAIAQVIDNVPQFHWLVDGLRRQDAGLNARL